jgi:hypothetical protein
LTRTISARARQCASTWRLTASVGAAGRKIYAIGEVCSHLGGPLAEGQARGRRDSVPVARFAVLRAGRVGGGWSGDAPAAGAGGAGERGAGGGAAEEGLGPIPPSRSWPGCGLVDVAAASDGDVVASNCSGTISRIGASSSEVGGISMT